VCFPKNRQDNSIYPDGLCNNRKKYEIVRELGISLTVMYTHRLIINFPDDYLISLCVFQKPSRQYQFFCVFSRNRQGNSIYPNGLCNNRKKKSKPSGNFEFPVIHTSMHLRLACMCMHVIPPCICMQQSKQVLPIFTAKAAEPLGVRASST
jgi:hypothetical protein